MTYTWTRVETSQVISTSPACVGAVLVTANGSGNADITLYDGTSASDPIIIAIRALQNQTRVVNFQPYLVTRRGLYVAIGDNVQGVVVQYSWEHE